MATEDIGLEVVRFLYKRMMIDAEWSVWSERGFKWWGCEIAQEIWAGEPFDEDGRTICYINIHTECLKGFDGGEEQWDRLRTIASTVSVSGFVAHESDPHRLRLAAHMDVYEDIKEGVQATLGWIAPIQVVESLQFAEAFGYLGDKSAQADISAHPVSGTRQDFDDILNVSGALALPAGEEPSRWSGSELTDIHHMLTHAPCLLSTGNEFVMTAEFPFPQHTCLLTVNTQYAHPLMGNGCRMVLNLPLGANDTATMKMAMTLNWSEVWGDLPTGYFLGSWHTTERGLTFTSFYPNALYKKGLLTNLVFNMVARARILSENVHLYSWDKNFEKDMQTKLTWLQSISENLS